jgi:pimeloyl-[acyl-carrier protein] methyl ester esterase
MGAARFLVEHLPQAWLAPVPGAGHAPFLSHPVVFLEKLRDFIQYGKTSERSEQGYQ